MKLTDNKLRSRQTYYKLTDTILLLSLQTLFSNNAQHTLHYISFLIYFNSPVLKKMKGKWKWKSRKRKYESKQKPIVRHDATQRNHLSNLILLGWSSWSITSSWLRSLSSWLLSCVCLFSSLLTIRLILTGLGHI